MQLQDFFQLWFTRRLDNLHFWWVIFSLKSRNRCFRDLFELNLRISGLVLGHFFLVRDPKNHWNCQEGLEEVWITEVLQYQTAETAAKKTPSLSCEEPWNIPVGSSALNASVFRDKSDTTAGCRGIYGFLSGKPRVPGAWSARRGEVPIEVDWREEMLFFFPECVAKGSRL